MTRVSRAGGGDGSEKNEGGGWERERERERQRRFYQALVAPWSGRGVGIGGREKPHWTGAMLMNGIMNGLFVFRCHTEKPRDGSVELGIIK